MKRLLITLTSLAVMVLATIVPAKPAEAIVGGERTQQYPWLVAFVEEDDGRPVADRVICSGALVSSRWVLTAAHCQLPREDTWVVIGRDDLRGGDGEKLRIQLSGQAHFRHPEWSNGNYTADVMLVKLDQPSSQTPLMVAGPGLASSWNVGGSVRIYGYGNTINGPTSYSHRAGFTIADFDSNHFTMYASYAGRSACGNDSGGPVIASTPSGPAIVGVLKTIMYNPCSSGGQMQIITKAGYRSSTTNSPVYSWMASVLSSTPEF